MMPTIPVDIGSALPLPPRHPHFQPFLVCHWYVHLNGSGTARLQVEILENLPVARKNHETVVYSCWFFYPATFYTMIRTGIENMYRTWNSSTSS